MELIKIKTATELWEEYIDDDDIRRSIALKQEFKISMSIGDGESEVLWFAKEMYELLGKTLNVDGWDDCCGKVTAEGWTWDEHWYSKIPEVNLDVKEIEKLI